VRVYPYRWVVLGAFGFLNLTIQILWIAYAPITSDAAQYYGVSELASRFHNLPAHSFELLSQLGALRRTSRVRELRFDCLCVRVERVERAPCGLELGGELLGAGTRGTELAARVIEPSDLRSDPLRVQPASQRQELRHRGTDQR
jgi:hypothetical protein